MKEILYKLSSRKLWMAIAGVATGVYLVLGGDASDLQTIGGAVTTLVSAALYILVEGKIDAEGVKNAIVEIDEALDLFEEE